MDTFKVYSITELGVAILKNKERVELREDRLKIKRGGKRRDGVKSSSRFDNGTFIKLKEIRTFIAKVNNIPPYMVFSDRTLMELSTFKPRSREQMLLIHGIGEIKFERYGKDFLEYLNIMNRINR